MLFLGQKYVLMQFTRILQVCAPWMKKNNLAMSLANPDLQRVVESKTLMSCFLLRQQLMLGIKIAQEGSVVL